MHTHTHFCEGAHASNSVGSEKNCDHTQNKHARKHTHSDIHRNLYTRRGSGGGGTIHMTHHTTQTYSAHEEGCERTRYKHAHTHIQFYTHLFIGPSNAAQSCDTAKKNGSNTHTHPCMHVHTYAHNNKQLDDFGPLQQTCGAVCIFGQL
eukprot:GDKI01018092.1.p1 GENE.GDKI01018092.1~~GDKI01018092.1.p1  ORF type:complete len:156 (-),score=45.07 GDKI01018092.1:34-480(-)